MELVTVSPRLLFFFFLCFISLVCLRKLGILAFTLKYYNSDRGYAISEEKRIWSVLQWLVETFQLTFPCSKSLIETLERRMKYVQS